MNDQQIDAFSRGIAGQPANPDSADGDALYHRMGAELREAVQAREADLDDEELAQFSLDQPHMKALQARVHRQLAPDHAAPAAPPQPAIAPRQGRASGGAGGLAAALDGFFGSTWGRGLTVLALASMATMLVLQAQRGGGRPDGGLIERSASATPTLTTPGPAALAAALETRLTGLGAQVIALELQPGQWTLKVTATDAAQMEAVQAVLREYGLPRVAGTEATVNIQRPDLGRGGAAP